LDHQTVGGTSLNVFKNRSVLLHPRCGTRPKLAILTRPRHATVRTPLSVYVRLEPAFSQHERVIRGLSNDVQRHLSLLSPTET